MSRCRCCNVELFEHEMKPKNEGMCNICISESNKEFSYAHDHQHVNEFINEGLTAAKPHSE